MIVLLPPSLDDYLSFVTIGKDPAIQALTAEGAIEAFDERVFPGTARRNVHRLTLAILEP